MMKLVVNEEPSNPPLRERGQSSRRCRAEARSAALQRDRSATAARPQRGTNDRSRARYRPVRLAVSRAGRPGETNRKTRAMRGQASLSSMRPVCAVLALLSVVTVLICLRLEVTLLANLRPTVSIELDFRHNDEPQTFPMADSYQLDVQPLAEALDQEVSTRHEPPILRGVFNEDDLPARETWTSGRHLIISYYEGQYSSARHQEVQGVIKENLSNEYLEKVHILLQDVTLEDTFVLELIAQWAERLVLVRLQQADHQPTYEDLFGYANYVLGRGTVAIVSNVDVVLGKTISCVREVTPENKAMFNQTMKRIILSPSRHPAPCGVRLGEWNECFKYRGSHDSFIFAPPLSSAVIGRMDFVQNLLGAENRLLSELRTEGYRLTNPCRVVRLTHRHCVRHSRKVQTKRFARRGDGRYASVDPISLFECGDVIY